QRAQLGLAALRRVGRCGGDENCGGDEHSHGAGESPHAESVGGERRAGGASGQDVAVPTYVAFLRAINLGPTRKFPKAAIVEAVEDCGFTDVETYINTGNVRFRCSLRSRAKVERALEKSFRKHAGFAVPTIVFTPAELRQVG